VRSRGSLAGPAHAATVGPRAAPGQRPSQTVSCSFQNRTISRLVVGKTGQRHLGSLWIRTSAHRLRSSVVAGAKWCGPRNSGSIGRIRAVPQGGPTGVLASLRTSPRRGTLSPGPPGIYRFAAAPAGWEPWRLARNVGPAGRVGTLAPRTACVAALCPAAGQRRNSNASLGSTRGATAVRFCPHVRFCELQSVRFCQLQPSGFARTTTAVFQTGSPIASPGSQILVGRFINPTTYFRRPVRSRLVSVGLGAA